MSYRQIKGTTIEVPDWVPEQAFKAPEWEKVPASEEFSEAKLAKSRLAIAYIRNKYFGSDVNRSDVKARPTRAAEKTKPQLR